MRAGFAGKTVSDLRFNLVNRLPFPELVDEGISGTFVAPTSANDERFDEVEPSSLPEMDDGSWLLAVAWPAMFVSVVRDENIEYRLPPESFFL